MHAFGLRFSIGHTLWAAILAPLCILLFYGTGYHWAGPAAVGLSAATALVTFRGRRLSSWLAALIAWFPRRRRPLHAPSEPDVGATVQPGDHVAVRWQGQLLVAIVELIPRPFTPTVIVDGSAHTDDVVDTRLLEQLLAVHCPDLEADIVSAGHRVGSTASAGVVSRYAEVIGSDPAPAYRRTWILLRACPLRTRKQAQRRDSGVAGLAGYLVASATRIADRLASNGVDAVCGRSFDDFDRACEVSFHRENWSNIAGHGSFTCAYAAPGGPDTWWSAPADHTLTRVRIAPGTAPQSAVLLTTAAKPKNPSGFSRLSGGQRLALEGRLLRTDRHRQLPIGSAGVLIGETASGHPVYLPFDDVDVSLNLGDARTFTRFALRAAAAGGIVTLGPRFSEFAGMIGAEIGPEARVAWPTATTYLSSRPGAERVTLRHNMIGTPRHPQLPIRPITLPDENRYRVALPAQGGINGREGASSKTAAL